MSGLETYPLLDGLQRKLLATFSIWNLGSGENRGGLTEGIIGQELPLSNRSLIHMIGQNNCVVDSRALCIISLILIVSCAMEFGQE